MSLPIKKGLTQQRITQEEGPLGGAMYIAMSSGVLLDWSVDRLQSRSTVSPLETNGFRKSADPVRDQYGPGRISHPEEWEMTLDTARQAGAKVVERPGALAYEPGNGGPGRLIIDPDASITALKHEVQHLLDDQALGYPGLGHYIQNPNVRWSMEFNAYKKEIDYLRSMRDFSTARQVLQNARAERILLDSTFGLGGGR